MALQEMTSARLRALTETQIPSGRVISLYLDLDPGTFGAPPARASAIRSAIDQLGRHIEALSEDIGHDELTALRADRDRLESFLTGELDVSGLRGIAIFASGPADLWEVVPLPHAVRTQVAVDTVAHVDQIARQTHDDRWAVVLVSREHGRVLRGNTHGLVETLTRDDDVHGQHDQGGWSQARYQRSVDREADSHVDALMEDLHRAFRRRRFDHLLFVLASELWPAVERSLHPDLQSLVVGRVEAEVEYSTPDDVLRVARPEMERVEIERERELIGRLNQGLGTGDRAVAGLQPTLDMLVQQRVEALLIADGFTAAGAVCPRCGWMGADPGAGTCPADGQQADRVESVVDAAVGSALAQDAAVVFVPRRDDPADDATAPSGRFLEMQGHGGIAAVLRF